MYEQTFLSLIFFKWTDKSTLQAMLDFESDMEILQGKYLLIKP